MHTPTKRDSRRIVEQQYRAMVTRQSNAAGQMMDQARALAVGAIKAVLYKTGERFVFQRTKLPKPFLHQQTVEIRKCGDAVRSSTVLLKEIRYVRDTKFPEGRRIVVDAWVAHEMRGSPSREFDISELSLESVDSIARYMAVYYKPSRRKEAK